MRVAGEDFKNLMKIPTLARAGAWPRRFYRALMIRLRASGTPFSKDVWEAQYRRGHWDSLGSIDHTGHNMIIADYVQHINDSPSILDVGCGTGLLLRLLTRFGFKRYHGIDLSAEAISTASSLRIENAILEVADFEQWRPPPNQFDVIIFNESLYYTRRPASVLLEYSNALDEKGVMIVSMFRARHIPYIWWRLDRHFAVMNSTRLKNDKGEVWDIRVLRRKQPNRRSS
ncbi:MAG: hypothetical protein DMF49_13060 [Acidobacteria bacterium]|nr:MAG: hypothetical protein DMF49_13060 [Acidobacteriota bacterium]